MMFTMDTFIALIPEVVAFVFMALVLMAGVFAPAARGLVTGLALVGALAVFGNTAALLAVGFQGSFFGGGYVVDNFSLYLKLVVAAAAFFSILAAARWAGQTGDAGEYLSLILAVALGSMLLVSTRDLFGIFVALELATIPSYALVAFDRKRRESSEGGMKYLLTGMIASSILLYGIVLIYGVTGSASLSDTIKVFAGPLSPVAILGLVLLISGFAFKLSAAPFHFWTPDAYQGAPTSAAAFLSVAPKMATFGVLLRILTEGMPQAVFVWTALLTFISILTMFTGNLLALRQTNVKRMLAYSSVAHSGYILAAFVALTGKATQTAIEAVLIYSAAYALMNLGAFFVVEVVGEEGKNFNGLWKVHPGLALSMGIFMAALVGIPPFSGFFGKAWVILADAQAGAWVVVGAVVINSVLSVPYYFGVIRNMFFEEPVVDAASVRGGGALKFSIYALAVATTLFVFFVGPLSALARSARLL